MAGLEGALWRSFTLFCVVLSVFVSGSATAGDLVNGQSFVRATSSLFASPDKAADPLGQVYVAAPVELLERQADGWRRIAITGWAREGADRLVVAAPGIRVPRAALRKGMTDRLNFGISVEHAESAAVWTQTTMTGWLPPETALVPDLDEIWRNAEALFQVRCTVCHERRIPGNYTANQWTSYIKVMGPRTGLPNRDQELIRVYLQHHSSDAKALTAAVASPQ